MIQSPNTSRPRPRARRSSVVRETAGECGVSNRWIEPARGYDDDDADAADDLALRPLPVVPAPAGAAAAVTLAALSRRASRLRRRAAVFLWIVPFAATLSSRRATCRNSVSALPKSPDATAPRNDFTCCLTASFRARLRARLLRFWRMRFLADSEWATFVNLP